MSVFLPWIRIFLAVLAYILFALLASMIVRRIGKDLKEMEGRSSSKVLLIGAITNLCVLATTILLLVFLDKRPIRSLGISFSDKDLAFTIIGAATIFVLAVTFIGLLRISGKFQVRPHKPVGNFAEILNLSGGLVVLLIVALQEEVLYRGYITLNLLSYGPVVVVITSAILFTAIHLLTNRANAFQIVSWLVGGLVFAYIYLISGSIWVPIALHFTTDATNLLVFNIIGQFSIFKVTPSLKPRQLAIFRVGCAVVLVIALLTLFGPAIQLA